MEKNHVLARTARKSWKLNIFIRNFEVWYLRSIIQVISSSQKVVIIGKTKHIQY